MLFLIIHSIGISSAPIFFDDDVGYDEIKKAARLSIPVGYDFQSSFSSPPASRSWSIKRHSLRDGDKVIGRLSLIEPVEDSDTCEARLVVVSCWPFADNWNCLAAITKYMIKNGREIVFEAFGKKVSSLTVYNIRIRNPDPFIKKSTIIGWNVIDDAYRSFNLVLLLENTMSTKVEAVLPDFMVAAYFNKLFKSKL